MHTSQSNHPLDPLELKRKKVTKIKDWNEWLEFWQTTKVSPMLTGLLHAGFTVECLNPDERAMFYIGLADGHREYDHHRSIARNPPTRATYPRTEDQLPIYEIRRKAFQILCHQVFSPTRTLFMGEPAHWEWITKCPGLLDAIIWFFRLDLRGEFVNLSPENAERDPHTKTCAQFLESLCRYALDSYGRCERDRISTDGENNIRMRRRQFVYIAHGLSRYDIIVGSRFNTQPEVTVPLLDLSLRIPLSGLGVQNRLPNNFNEALARGSPAALVYAQVDAIRKVRNKQTETSIRLAG